MKRFEEYVALNWTAWDKFGDDWYFHDCDLNPEFFVGKEEDLKDIYALSEIHGIKPTVYFSFDDTGFLVQVYVPYNTNDDEEVIKTWDYQGVISCGPKVN